MTKDSTCAEVGEAVLTCTKCGFTESRKIPLRSHKLEYKVKEAGHEGTCTECGHTTGVEEHTYGYCSISADEHHQVCTKCGSELAGSNGAHVYVDYRCKDCSAWGKGPAGGYVFYDCDADNDRGNSDGLISTECGWRFLEASPADLRVIGDVPTVDANAAGYDKATKKFYFGFYRTSPEGENLAIDAKKEIGTGKENTGKFYAAMGEKNAYRNADDQTDVLLLEYPARLCSILKYTGADGETYDDWFLPSLNEMKQMYDNLIKNGLGSFEWEEYFHSSVTGSGKDSFSLWAYRFYDEAGHWYDMSCNRQLKGASIRPIRAFQPET